MTARNAPSAPLKPVSSRKTVHDQVYDQLRDALISGAFEAGEPFTIAALAARFQTSHMPVREALRRLAAERALLIATTGTAYVPDITRAELHDITRARIIIEGATAELAGPRLTPADLTALAHLLDRHEHSGLTGQIAEMTHTNRAFHFRIYQAAGSPVLLSQIENLWLRSGPYVRFLSDRMAELLRSGPAERFVRHHHDMLAALRAGDWAALRTACEADIAGTCSSLEPFLQA